MGGQTFWRAVDEATDLELMACVEGATPADDYVEVKHKPTGGCTRIPPGEILRVPAADLIAVIRYERPARIMKAMSGDVGGEASPPAVPRSSATVAVAA